MGYVSFRCFTEQSRRGGFDDPAEAHAPYIIRPPKQPLVPLQVRGVLLSSIMAERPKLIAEALLRGRSLPPTSGAVAQALMGTPAPRPTSLYAQGLLGNNVGYGLSNYPTPPQPTLGQAFGKDAFEFASGLTAPLSALDRMGRSMLGQEGGWQGREDMAGDASTLAGLVTMTPGVPATGLGMGMRSLSAIENSAKSKGVSLYVSETPERITVSKIVVPKDGRGKGTGTSVMNEIAEYADSTGKDVVLTPSDSFGGSVPKLKKFYSRLGFKENSGRNKDFRTRETMIRPGKLST